MKAEDLFVALTDLDDKMVTEAKPTETQKAVRLAPVKRSPWKALIAAAASVAVIGAAGVVYANRGMIWNIVHSASDNTVKAPDIYPEMAAYQYKGDYTGLTSKINGMVEPTTVYDNFDDLLAASDLVVAGTFLDYPYQTQDPLIDAEHPFPPNYIYLPPHSLNRLQVDKVLCGDAEIGDELIIYAYGGVMGSCFYSGENALTPMLKGDSWIYFLREVFDSDGTVFYVPTVSGTSSRYPIPDTHNTFVFSNNTLGVFDEKYFNTEINEQTQKLYAARDKYPEEAKFVSNGEHTDISNAELGIVDYIFSVDFASLLAYSDLVVEGEFIDDAYQNIDPKKPWERKSFPLEYPHSYNRLKIDKLCYSSERAGAVKIGDDIVIRESYAIADGTLHYTSNDPRPMKKGERWLYFLNRLNDGTYYPVIYMPSGDDSVMRAKFEPGNKIYEQAEHFQKTGEYTRSIYFLSGVNLDITSKYVNKAGEDVVFKAVMKNNTDQDFTLYTGNEYDPYRFFAVRFEVDDKVIEDVYSGGIDDAVQTLTLKPGDEYTQELRIKTDGLAPGRYTGLFTFMTHEDVIEPGTVTMWIDFVLTD